MVSKILKIVLDAILSFIFFFVAAILLDWVAGKIFGTHAGADGDKVINVNGGVMVVVTLALTLAFAAWLYKFLTNHTVTKVKG